MFPVLNCCHPVLTGFQDLGCNGRQLEDTAHSRPFFIAVWSAFDAFDGAHGPTTERSYLSLYTSHKFSSLSSSGDGLRRGLIGRFW